jgi:hypothetical protein
MPYTTEELKTNDFYQGIARRDEAKYSELIQERTTSGNIDGGILRDINSGNIILFENIIEGEGTDGTSHKSNYTLTWVRGYFEYEKEETISKIIEREFTEF